MVVRGDPGTGKTTLTLAMLEAFYGRKIYITGRRSRRGVLDDYPWLGSVEGHEIEIVDRVTVDSNHTAALPDPPDGSPPIDETVLAGVMDSLPPPLRRAWGRQGSLDDLAREFAWVPVGMRRVLGRLASQGRAMIVVDPWDAFVDELVDLAPRVPNGPAVREQLERSALRLLARGSAHLVLVLEHREPSQLDYLVDGIIATRYVSRDGAPERWISTPKLRGIRIDTESYPYTLEGGRFTCIAPEPATYTDVPIFIEPDPEPAPESIWPGSRAYAETFGPLKLGELTMIESDSKTPDAGIRSLTFPMIGSVMRTGGRVVYEPPPSQRVTDLWEGLAGSFTPAQFQAQVRVVSPGSTLPEGHPLLTSMVHVPRPMGAAEVASVPHSQTPKGREFLAEPPPGTAPGLSVFSGDGLRAIGDLTGRPYTPEGLAIVAKSYLVGRPIHMVFVTRTGDPLAEGLRMLASTQLTLENRQGRTFLYGRRPRTPGFVLTHRGAEEERAYNLLRIV